MEVFDMICEGLYIGNAYTSHQLNVLKKYGITHVITAGNHLTTPYPDNFTYKHLMVDDVPTENLLQYFDECAAFID